MRRRSSGLEARVILDADHIASWLRAIGRGGARRSAERYLAKLAGEGVELVAIPTGGRDARGVTASALAEHLGCDGDAILALAGAHANDGAAADVAA